jgi:hypothetical protein
MIPFALFFLLLGCMPLCAAAETGRVDWIGGHVTAVGYGTAPQGVSPAKALLNARRAAEIDAQRALLEAVKGVHIDAQTTVDNSMQRDIATRTRIEGVVRGSVIARQDVTLVNGAPVATVTMQLCLDGRSAECADKPALVSAIHLDRFEVPDDARFSSGEQSVATSPKPAAFDRSRLATALILNLGGQRYERVLLPVVVARTKGESTLVYGVRRVAPEVVRTNGIVRYAASLEQGRGMATAGVNPVVIEAEAVSADNRIIIAPQDAAILEEALRYGNNFLEKGMVVVVSQ